MQQETVALHLHSPWQGKLLAVAADELVIPLVEIIQWQLFAGMRDVHERKSARVEGGRHHRRVKGGRVAPAKIQGQGRSHDPIKSFLNSFLLSVIIGFRPMQGNGCRFIRAAGELFLCGFL